MPLPQRDIDLPLFEIAAGWTAKIGPFSIYLNDALLDLTGMTITLKLRRASGVEVVAGGAIEILDQTTNRGKLNYTPVATDFTYEANLYTIHQPYQLRWQIIDAAGKIAYSPSQAPSIVMVHRT